MFNKIQYSENKLLVEITDHSINHEIYEPVVRKIGGVWNKTLNGWLFDTKSDTKVDEFIKKQNKSIAESQNKEYYTKFSEKPDTYRTPSSASSRSSAGMNEAFDLIQELFDRVSDLEKTVEDLVRKLNKQHR
jgi:hypothetical protein